ncbi:MAG: endonuclease/exonuclease/phosphatase family protein [Opitutaceae bacterium]|nr:endonuclease/exonuclease/phosphatase family protein [Opitutaceae bacterium]
MHAPTVFPRLLLTLAAFLAATVSTTPVWAVEKPALAEDRTFAVVVYNVENLHDLDGVAVYEDYQPAVYTTEHLRVKAANIATVLARVDKGAGPAVVAFNEIELDQTPASTVTDLNAWLASVADRTLAELTAAAATDPKLAGLPAEAWLLKACVEAGLTGYHVATTDERPGTHGDGRGVAIRNLLFSRFPITATRSHATEGARAILEVTLDVDGSPFTVFVNHWKSGASDLQDEETRRGNARVLRERLDELLKADANADFIITGDLNSHYNQKQRYRDMRSTGINDILGSQGNELAVRGRDRDLYNLWFELPSDQRGSDTYRNEWGTLMHLIIGRGLYDQNGVQYIDNSFAVMKFPGLNANSLGLPNRWSRGRVPAGFSDHFPLYARFRVVGDGPKDKWIPLTRPSETAEGTGTAVSAQVSAVELFATAVKYDGLPKGTDIRDGTYTGRIFYIDGPTHVNEQGHVKVTLDGVVYDVFSHQRELRDELRNRVKRGDKIKFYGELGQFRGNWQFVLQGKEWLK